MVGPLTVALSRLSGRGPSATDRSEQSVARSNNFRRKSIRRIVSCEKPTLSLSTLHPIGNGSGVFSTISVGPGSLIASAAARKHHQQPPVHPFSRARRQFLAKRRRSGIRSDHVHQRGGKRYAQLFIPPSNQHSGAVNILLAQRLSHCESASDGHARRGVSGVAHAGTLRSQRDVRRSESTADPAPPRCGL